MTGIPMRLAPFSFLLLLCSPAACGPGVDGDGDGGGSSSDDAGPTGSGAQTDSSADAGSTDADTGPAPETDTAPPPPPADPCDPLDVEEGAGIPPECQMPFTFAWNGEQCQQLCECEGPHCDLITEDVESCFAGRWECPSFTEACPMQEGTATLTGGVELITGVFGTSSDSLRMIFASDNLQLAHSTHIRFAQYEPSGSGLSIRLPSIDAPGEYAVTGGLIQEAFESEWTGTLTVTDLVMDGDPGTWRISGSLTISGRSGSYEGDFTDVPGCAQITS